METRVKFEKDGTFDQRWSASPFLLAIKNRVAQKLGSIILLHFGLVTSLFAIPNTMKVYFLWFGELLVMTMIPRNHYSGL